MWEKLQGCNKMVTENIGLRGYLGEKIVEKWLEKKYPDHEHYKIVRQIIPIKKDESRWIGGGHLDFGIIKDNKVKAIYEVKTQEPHIEEINLAWKYIKENINEKLEFEIQNDKEKRRIPSDNNLDLKVVLLTKARDNVNLDKNEIIWFKEIFDDKNLGIENIDYKKDITDEIENIRKIAKKHKKEP